MISTPEPLTVALGAIPNSSKTTLFNRLTGANQSTGNWPGVSMGKKVVHLLSVNIPSS